ncbi:ribosomal protein L12E/L44/L45/RPP1/RPP2 [Saccharothrix ecbatanensis]|uniref:Ribosomal protein L12E/L44/L45/RPP1/RPP2 n=1 Tax=Saccharothrix ecbatanensis TaxID=1105145 RepID=A0A7W9HG24_9PSEU|nr:hypothetical protein [Saccharothrix ecbatanensis]MBB5801603.1 ribosomal protein L12E/L44/L45/RPP1/RPP2 [Saccharothrix ecbatanensis]
MDKTLEQALVGLAGNPSAPLDVLMRLVPVPVAAKVMAWRQRVMPDALAERLLDTGDSTVALALDDAYGRVSDAVLRMIAEHRNPEVRDARRRYIERMLDGSAHMSVDELLQVAGWTRAAGSAGSAASAALTDAAKDARLAELARSPDPRLRHAVGRSWAGMPEDVRRALSTDPDPDVRASVAGYPHGRAPDDLHERLLADPATRGAVLSYAVLTPEIAAECMAVDDEEVRAELALNPTLPAAMRDELARDPSELVRAWVIVRQDVTDDERERLYRRLQAEAEEQGPFRGASTALSMLIQIRIDWLRALPVPERLHYLHSPIPAFRIELARCDDLPPEAFDVLDRDEDAGVRLMATFRPDTPGAVLERMLLEHGENERYRPLLVEHPNFPSEALVRLSTDPDPQRRRYTLGSPALPDPIVSELTRDPDVRVRCTAAGHPNLLPADAERLLDDDDPTVVKAAAAAPALPTEAMTRLLDRAGC